MKTTVSPTGRMVISALVLWHMAAVAIFAFPPEVTGWMQEARWKVLPMVRPYVLMFSQWQQWNLFSPDPYRRVTIFRVETAAVGPWQMLERVNAESFPFSRRSSWAKYFTGLLDDTSDGREGIRQRFLQTRCKHHALAPETRIRLIFETRILPKNEDVQSVSWWTQQRFPVMETTVTTTSCPV